MHAGISHSLSWRCSGIERSRSRRRICSMLQGTYVMAYMTDKPNPSRLQTPVLTIGLQYCCCVNSPQQQNRARRCGVILRTIPRNVVGARNIPGDDKSRWLEFGELLRGEKMLWLRSPNRCSSTRTLGLEHNLRTFRVLRTLQRSLRSTSMS